MAPITRSQAVRDAVSTSDTPPKDAVAEQQRSSSIRLRQTASNQFAATEPSQHHRNNVPDEPPRFIIDLSLPPEQRYLEVCAAFRDEMLNLTSLFDEVVGGMVSLISITWLRRICKLCLRRIYNEEENAELKGISRATGVEMYLLVCFNVLLDLFMGCSSGGATVRAGADMNSKSKMVHFRTLDWGMPALRRVTVQLDYVAEKDGPVIASSITYVGFVGVLTGVRKNLSMSLNFRANRVDNGHFWSDAKYVWHLLMVLLGQRPSISSVLRRFLLPHRKKMWYSWLPFTKPGEAITLGYFDIVRQIGGHSEKDHISAVVRSNDEFMVVTNADSTPPVLAKSDAKGLSPMEAALQELTEEAKTREQCAIGNWANMRAAKANRFGLHILSEQDIKTLSEFDEVVEMVQKYPTTNECTHLACVMDPVEGKVAWCRRWIEPISAKWIREHTSYT
ncbi:hypothetical protein LTR37_005851 [Vermiconidia calcicola]|uniref:Uncharacterized protein n=1 Tax=Vermiconidia calcicola TaxID=1690605 RepID=A0ACC3NI59_9PEZI|nr:hypothetical protein LTR37_005851 [Vermiconidia calcicola]